MIERGFHNVSVSQESACNAGNMGDTGSIPGRGRPPREGNGNPLQYSWLGNLMDRGSWWVTVQRVAKTQTWLRERERDENDRNYTTWNNITCKLYINVAIAALLLIQFYELHGGKLRLRMFYFFLQK